LGGDDELKTAAFFLGFLGAVYWASAMENTKAG